MIDQTIQAAAAHLLGREPDAIERVKGGGNNQIFKVREGAHCFALKCYANDGRDRLGAEFDGLRFLAGNGIACVPNPVACAREQRIALYNWVDGTNPGELGDHDIDAMFAFMTRLGQLAALPEARQLAPASDACLRFGAVFDQFEARLARLSPYLDGHGEVRDFIAGSLVPARDKMLAGYRQALAEHRFSLADSLPDSARILSPSDFGRHNMLRSASGELVFLDFEYFGWDDPVKFTCDLILHPGSQFPRSVQIALLQRAQDLFSGADNFFVARLYSLLRVFGLIWCLILLNEFIPDVWRRRVLSGSAYDLGAAQQRQLGRSQKLFKELEEGNLVNTSI
jgi:hypothetical protein